MQYHVLNALSLNMLDHATRGAVLRCIPLSLARARAELEGCELIVGIGHPDTARVVADQLGYDGDEWASAAEQRPTVALALGDAALVAQYHGPRLSAGATALPDGARIEFWAVSVEPLAGGLL